MPHLQGTCGAVDVHDPLKLAQMLVAESLAVFQKLPERLHNLVADLNQCRPYLSRKVRGLTIGDLRR